MIGVEVSKSKFVSFYSKDRLLRIKKSDILFIQTESYYSKSMGEKVFPGSGNYTRLTTTKGEEYFTTMLIADWKRKLKEDEFIRTHQSIVVNMEHANALIFEEGNCIELEGDIRLPVSYRKRKMVIEAFYR